MISQQVFAQDTIRYCGNTLVNVDYHHGMLQPAVGVHNIQIFRANRQHPEEAEGFGWTYNHAPMLCYWNNTFYVEYLSDSVGESVPPGHTLLLHSKDGYKWSKPEVIFPVYKVPDGTTKPGNPNVAKNLYAVMHQRMGFYVSKDNRLLVLGYYGICLDAHDDPNDGNGIGRVVREVYKDGSYGPIYFLHYNHNWNEKNTDYPFYMKSKDKGFIKACSELMATSLMMQQWNEEADRDDPLIPLQKEYKAFNYYHLPNGKVVGLWKYALTSVSTNEGKSWQYNPTRAPFFVNANAKIWGQKTSDNKYATVYNPSEFRWPLAISVSEDGWNYKNLLLVNGEITQMRYGGNYKSYGPQYVRGIIEGNGTPPDGNLWVTYSMNKEDIWVSSLPVPVTAGATTDAHDVFDTVTNLASLQKWNIYSPLWAPVSMAKTKDNVQAIKLQDQDPFDYAKAERIIPAAVRMTADFTIVPAQNNAGLLEVEFVDKGGLPGIRIAFDSTGECYVKSGYRNKKLFNYKADSSYSFHIQLNAATRFYTISVNGKSIGNNLFFQPLHAIERIAFRTGAVNRFPNADTPTDQDFDLPNAGAKATPAVFYITQFCTQKQVD
ncbi:six-hairpin glycosidase [Ilyomonas limi]|uniref:Six-hairpin glycosidase n=1 Tax=Ilyomonas limi TaxID=2575867 RepID=A0A4U3KXB9_9BACT|nr:six-hairpin glycosidase [Ilyomonas limi]TKK65806.1 six-hairpin glycosidase [Ilyomonas limi]